MEDILLNTLICIPERLDEFINIGMVNKKLYKTHSNLTFGRFELLNKRDVHTSEHLSSSGKYFVKYTSDKSGGSVAVLYGGDIPIISITKKGPRIICINTMMSYETVKEILHFIHGRPITRGMFDLLKTSLRHNRADAKSSSLCSTGPTTINSYGYFKLGGVCRKIDLKSIGIISTTKDTRSSSDQRPKECKSRAMLSKGENKKAKNTTKRMASYV